LLRYLFSVKGKSVLESGCGPGLLALAAAKLGAAEVWATDPRPDTIDALRRNAEKNGVELRTKVGEGFDPVGGRLFDLIIAVPPQLPCPPGAPVSAGAGLDGLKRLEPLARCSPEYLERGGQLLTAVSGFADVKRFETLLNEQFRFRSLPAETIEWRTADLAPGQADYLEQRRAAGQAEFESADGVLRAPLRPYLAMRR
jgi:release factor glutamine methyltransferase